MSEPSSIDEKTEAGYKVPLCESYRYDADGFQVDRFKTKNDKSRNVRTY